MIISDIVYKKNVYKTEDNNLVAIREDNTSATVIPIKSSPEHINRFLKIDWEILAKFETTYSDLQWNIKKVTDNFAFGPLEIYIDEVGNVLIRTYHDYISMYIKESVCRNTTIKFNPMLIWEELENNFVDEDTEITCELYKHPYDNNGGILKIHFPEYYIIIASLRDD